MRDRALWVIAYGLMTVPLWKIFLKAGRSGWQAFVPLWNTVALLKIVGRPRWWLILLVVPVVNLVTAVVVTVDLARSFSKSDEFAAGMVLLPPLFYAMLAFGPEPYTGAVAGQPIGQHTDVTW